jgi:hypothetical protein
MHTEEVSLGHKVGAVLADRDKDRTSARVSGRQHPGEEQGPDPRLLGSLVGGDFPLMCLLVSGLHPVQCVYRYLILWVVVQACLIQSLPLLVAWDGRIQESMT